jgi:hypothetical protein
MISSDLFVSFSWSCFELNFRNCFPGTLNVRVNEVGSGNTLKATWTKSGNQGNKWFLGQLSPNVNNQFKVSWLGERVQHGNLSRFSTIGDQHCKHIFASVYALSFRYLNFQVTFEGVRGSGYRGDIAIDDIKILKQGCQQKGKNLSW